MGRVLVLGSLNLDLVTRVRQQPRPGETVRGEGLRRMAGGKGANQAAAAAAAGAQVRMIGAVGEDDAGSAYVARLEARGVDTSGIAVLPGEVTGTALIVVDERGENAIVVVAGANGRVGADALDPVDRLDEGDVLLVQLEVPLPTVAEACRRAAARGARVVLNLAPVADLPEDVIAVADPLVVNEHEAASLGEARPASLATTHGAAGADWDDLHVPAAPVAEVVDSTGAGDAFCGALAAALADGADRRTALEVAVAAGAEACAYEGAQRSPELG